MNQNFKFVDAKYRTIADPRYSDNPYIAALPELPSDRVLMRELSVLPPFDPAERLWSAAERAQRLDILHGLVIPLQRHVDLARSMWRMLITGYGPRKPFSKSQNAIAKAIYEMQQSGEFASLHDAPLAAQYSMSLFGSSGSGKTFMLRQIAGMFPRVIYHPELGKWQIPFLIIEMSYDGASIHTFASSIFAALDALLPDGRYSELYAERKNQNAEQRLMKALSIALELGVGFIVVDEAQNKSSIGNVSTLKPTTTKAAERLTKESALIKLLITASNISHIPLMLAGTLEMKTMHMGRFSRARRTSGRGSARWLPLECSGSVELPGEFEFFLMGLLRYQWIRNPISLDDEWVARFHHYTQGIPDMAVKLWESCQDYAISSEIETIDAELVEAVFEAEYQTAAFGLNALRTKDKLLLEAVTDLYDSNSLDGDSSSLYGMQPSNLARDQKAKATKPLRASPPSPTPEPISVDILANCDIRDGKASGLDIGHMTGDQWQEELTP